VIGLGDRALGHKARVNGPARTTTLTGMNPERRPGWWKKLEGGGAVDWSRENSLEAWTSDT